MSAGAADAVAALAGLPGVAEAVDRAREACTALRWHEGLRRRIPEAAAESRVRGAWASSELDGAPLGLDIVRDLIRGAVSWHEPPDPVERVAKGAVAATLETEHVDAMVRTAPRQALARLHVAAAAALLAPADLGRPRAEGEDCRELVDLGPAPGAAEVSAWLSALADVLATPGLPVGLVAAVAHAEVATTRPFLRGNGVVARAMERAVVHAGGLDPTGVAVPEVGYTRLGGPAYLGALSAYATGTADGVRLWLIHASDALTTGAAEGGRVAEAVRAGRLG